MKGEGGEEKGKEREEKSCRAVLWRYEFLKIIINICSYSLRSLCLSQLMRTSAKSVELTLTMMMRKISRLALAATREAVSDGAPVFQTCPLLKQDLHVVFAKAKSKTGSYSSLSAFLPLSRPFMSFSHPFLPLYHLQYSTIGFLDTPIKKRASELKSSGLKTYTELFQCYNGTLFRT